YQAKDFQPGELTCVFGGLPLGVVEIGGNGDYRTGDRFTEVGFSPILQFAQNERGDFRRGEKLVAEFYADEILAGGVDAKREEAEFVLDIGNAASHKPFDGV